MEAHRIETHIDFLITRQPVFDQRLQTWGAALDFYQPEESGPLFPDELTTSLMFDSYLPQRRQNGFKTQVGVDPVVILEGHTGGIEPEGVFLAVDESAGATPGLCEAVAVLKGLGFGVAVTDFRDRPADRGLDGLADILVLDMEDDADALAARIRTARALGALVQIRHLLDWSQMSAAREAGADLFQGFFFNKLDAFPQHANITPRQITRLRLLERIDQTDVDFNALTRIVAEDAPLAYRLLTYLNSASLSIPHKVDSVQQAIVLLGWKPLRNWLKIVLLTDLAGTGRHEEFCYFAAQRANFLSRVGAAAGLNQFVPSLSLLGLFSLLESILGMPMAQALSAVPVADGIKAALLGGQSAFTAWLKLIDAMETAQRERIEAMGKSIGLSLGDLSRCYREAFWVTDALFRNLPRR
jgi:EAL and modified HD-GYP domain-containing signal transduction protein